MEQEQQTAEWISKIPDKVGDDGEDSKTDPSFSLDVDELPDLTPGKSDDDLYNSVDTSSAISSFICTSHCSLNPFTAHRNSVQK